MEPPRPRLSDRAGPPLLNTATPRVRIRRRGRGAHDDAPVDRSPRPDSVTALRAVVLIAAFVLAVTSRGDVVVLGLLLGLGSGRRSSALTAGGALVAAMVRWGSPSLGAIAGAQAVLGPAGWTGTTAAVMSAWLAAVALICAARPVSRANFVVSAGSAVPFAVAAAAVVVGPSSGGGLALRIAGSFVALGAATVVARFRWTPWCGGVAAVAALTAAGLAR